VNPCRSADNRAGNRIPWVNDPADGTIHVDEIFRCRRQLQFEKVTRAVLHGDAGARELQLQSVLSLIQSNGNQTEALFTGDSTGDNTNPLDTTEYFVRQQYVDILVASLMKTGLTTGAIRYSLAQAPRIASAPNARRGGAFFIEKEAQQTGSFHLRRLPGSARRRPAFSEYSFDRQQVMVETAWKRPDRLCRELCTTYRVHDEVSACDDG